MSTRRKLRKIIYCNMQRIRAEVRRITDTVDYNTTLVVSTDPLIEYPYSSITQAATDKINRAEELLDNINKREFEAGLRLFP